MLDQALCIKNIMLDPKWISKSNLDPNTNISNPQHCLWFLQCRTPDLNENGEGSTTVVTENDEPVTCIQTHGDAKTNKHANKPWLTKNTAKRAVQLSQWVNRQYWKTTSCSKLSFYHLTLDVLQGVEKNEGNRHHPPRPHQGIWQVYFYFFVGEKVLKILVRLSGTFL